MNILLASTPILGHINPVISLGKILRAAGHDVLFTTGSVFRDRVEAAGLAFHPLEGAADLDTRDVDALYPERKELEPGLPRLNFDLNRTFVDVIPAQYSTLRTILNFFPADIIVGDTIFTGLLPFLLGAVKNRPAIVSLGITVMTYRRDDGAPFGPGLPLAVHPAQIQEYEALSVKVDHEVYEPLKKRVDEMMERFGAQHLPMPFMDALTALPDLYLQTGVPGFDYPRSKMPPNVHFVGSLEAKSNHGLSSNALYLLEEARRAGKKVVLVTQGTIENRDLDMLLGPTLRAFAGRDDLFVLATTGGRALAAVPQPIPDNALVAEYLAFDKVWPMVDLFITNGGYGTVTQALSEGIPMVVAGTSEEKPEIAARVAWTGAGIDLRTERPLESELASAAARILSEPSFRMSAERLRAQFKQYDAPREVCSLLTWVASSFNCQMFDIA